MYNFAIVGVLAVFYQKGLPIFITQAYLVATSVIVAWQLSNFNGNFQPLMPLVSKHQGSHSACSFQISGVINHARIL